MKSGDHADVVIIGAGAAGLAAGHALSRAGRRVIIIEARDRIGGRIHTLHVGGAVRSVPIELGAEFIHGLPPASWSLIGEAQLPTFELRGEPFCFEGSHLTACGDRQGAASGVMQQMGNWLAKRPPGSDLSFAGYLQAADLDADSATRAAAYVEGFNAADKNKISAIALMRQQRSEELTEGDRIFHIASGYDSLPGYLAACSTREGAQIRLHCPVREVRWRKGAATVSGYDSKGNQFRVAAPQVLVTLPLGVLQSNTVAFDPPPAGMAQQWNLLAMGDAERITLLFDQRFWAGKVPDMGFLFAPGEMISTWWTPMPDVTPFITGWAGGTDSHTKLQQAGITSVSAFRSAALSTLGTMFGVSVSTLERWLLGAYYHDWRTDPFSRGSYSYVAVGGVNAAPALSTPVDETLFFAGEHTDIEDQWGTVHAALASGLRAANQILEGPTRRF